MVVRLAALGFPNISGEAVAESIHLSGHMFVAGRGQNTLAQPADTVNIESLHLIDGHVLGPQIDTHGILLGLIPQSNANGLGFRKPFFGFVGSIPFNLLRGIGGVEVYGKLDRGLFHGTKLHTELVLSETHFGNIVVGQKLSFRRFPDLIDGYARGPLQQAEPTFWHYFKDSHVGNNALHTPQAGDRQRTLR